MALDHQINNQALIVRIFYWHYYNSYINIPKSSTVSVGGKKAWWVAHMQQIYFHGFQHVDAT